MNKRKKLLLITNILGPLRFPVYNALAGDDEFQIQMLFLARTDTNRQWEIPKDDIAFEYKVLPGKNFYLVNVEVPIYFHWGLFREIRRYKPDVIGIAGYNHLATLLVALYGRWAGAKTVLWTGSHLGSGMVKSWPGRLLERYKCWIIPKFDAYVTYGTAATQQITHLGAAPERIVTGCNTIDVRWFEQQTAMLNEDSVKELRKQYPLINILYVGSFIQRKGAMQLIKAFKNLGRDDVGFILVGDGPEKKDYEKYIQENNLSNIYFVGFQQKNDIIKYYRISDIFVLPSHIEVWGLVVNEAMACRLPVLVSCQAGAARDIVEDGINGYIFDPEDVEELSSRLEGLINDEKKRVQMGTASRNKIITKTPEAYAESILKAARLALGAER